LNHLHARGEVDGHCDLSHPEANTGGLEILVKPMCLSGHRKDQPSGNGDNPFQSSFFP
jgi:hypothetical protein